jgi:NAD kinase
VIAMFEKIVLITRKTRLQELIEKFNTRAQAKFYIEHSGGDFEDYQKEDDAYNRSLEQAKSAIDLGLKVQMIDREFLSTFLFAQEDIVVALGQDGLVANAAKYVGEQPVLGVNPDPSRFDGILVPIAVAKLQRHLEAVVNGNYKSKQVTLAEAITSDGQKMLAFNDIFIGARSHISARYKIEFAGQKENHSSSGLIVSTGAGSTGWMSSVFNMARSICQFAGREPIPSTQFAWDDNRLIFAVREPFVSKHSGARIGIGVLNEGQELVIESRMPSGGTIFSDGIESDYIAFDSGIIAHIRAAKQRARLVI